MKKLIITLSFCLMLGIFATSAQTETSTSSTTTTSSQTSGEDNKMPMNTTGIIVGAIGLLALAGIIVYMVRNRNKTVGGIQSQDKTDPRPVTTQSINNPGSGV